MSLERQDYSLLVLDNMNLQELFPTNESRKFEITKGKLFFHMNPKLCMIKIQDFRADANIADLGKCSLN